MYKVLTLNNIAVAGLRRLPRERYEVASEIAHPDAVILRSHNMHNMDIPETDVPVPAPITSRSRRWPLAGYLSSTRRAPTRMR